LRGVDNFGELKSNHIIGREIKKMLFSVIYDFSCPKDLPVKRLYPSNFRKVEKKERIWDITEINLDPVIDGWKQRKICALLTKEEFAEFVNSCDLIADSTETMGSIGAPGLGYGISPAISFNAGGGDCYQNAYVTPIPEVNRANGFTERDWERIKAAILAKWGY